MWINSKERETLYLSYKESAPTGRKTMIRGLNRADRTATVRALPWRDGFKSRDRGEKGTAEGQRPSLGPAIRLRTRVRIYARARARFNLIIVEHCNSKFPKTLRLRLGCGKTCTKVSIITKPRKFYRIDKSIRVCYTLSRERYLLISVFYYRYDYI